MPTLVAVGTRAQLPVRPLRLEEQIEAMVNMQHGALHVGQHVLLLPENLRRVPELEVTEWFNPEVRRDVLMWDRLEMRPMAPTASRRCLWDLVALAGRGEGPIFDFIGQWGLLSWGEGRGLLSADEAGWCELAQWRLAVDTVTNWLRTLMATENGEPMSEDALWPLAHYVMLEMSEQGFFGVPEKWRWMTDCYQSESAHGLRLIEEPGWLERARQEWTVRWRIEQELGESLPGQRWLVSHALELWMDPYTSSVTMRWDHDGRRIEETAYGVMEIVGTQMAAIFTAPVPDVFVCSLCARPYEHAPDSRRPRANARRFCSETCQGAARRETNRVAWHRHKNEWRQPTARVTDTN